MEFIGFFWHRWLKFEISKNKRDNSILEKDSNSALNLKYKGVLKIECDLNSKEKWAGKHD